MEKYEWREGEEYSFSSHPFLFELSELTQFCYYSNACNKNKQKKNLPHIVLAGEWKRCVASSPNKTESIFFKKKTRKIQKCVKPVKSFFSNCKTGEFREK